MLQTVIPNVRYGSPFIFCNVGKLVLQLSELIPDLAARGGAAAVAGGGTAVVAALALRSPAPHPLVDGRIDGIGLVVVVRRCLAATDATVGGADTLLLLHGLHLHPGGSDLGRPTPGARACSSRCRTGCCARRCRTGWTGAGTNVGTGGETGRPAAQAGHVSLGRFAEESHFDFLVVYATAVPIALRSYRYFQVLSLELLLLLLLQRWGVALKKAHMTYY
mmetsp:Transcript_32531/g.71754  ORF Transcript_32531/g.71754 Transcript_32531/m.71754 type:complete len:220 (-) Transcript_32531:61-720(-)